MNLVNVEAVENFCGTLAARADRRKAKQWLRQNLRNHLLREPRLAAPVNGMEGLLRLKIEGYIDAVPEWAERAVARGDDLRYFHPEGCEYWDNVTDFVQAIHGVVDWINGLDRKDRRLRRLSKVSIDEAIGMSRRWHEALAKHAAHDWPEDWEGIETVRRFDDGVKFVRLTSAGALEREGMIMGHCAKGYAGRVQSGLCEVYSLRDVQNIPHVTIEVSNEKAIQIKGTANTVPVGRWAAFVRPFVVERGLAVGRDGEAIGMITVAGHTYTEARELVQDLPRISQAEDAAFRLDGIAPILRFISRWGSDLEAEGRRTILAALAPLGSEVRVTEEEALVSVSDVEIATRRVLLPGSAFAALRLGILKGCEEEVATAYRSSAQEALRVAKQSPDAIHIIEISAGGGGGVEVDKLFAFCGLYEEYRDVTSTCVAHKRRLASHAAGHIRQKLRPSRSASEAARARLINAMNVQLPRLSRMLEASGVA